MQSLWSSRNDRCIIGIHRGKKYMDWKRGWKEQMVELCNGVKNCVEEYSCMEGSLHRAEVTANVNHFLPIGYWILFMFGRKTMLRRPLRLFCTHHYHFLSQTLLVTFQNPFIPPPVHSHHLQTSLFLQLDFLITSISLLFQVVWAWL